MKKRKRITEGQLRLVASTAGTGDFKVFQTQNGWAIIAEFPEQAVEIETERGHLRTWKQLSAVASFIREVSPTTAEFVVRLANGDTL